MSIVLLKVVLKVVSTVLLKVSQCFSSNNNY